MENVKNVKNNLTLADIWPSHQEKSLTSSLISVILQEPDYKAGDFYSAIVLDLPAAILAGDFGSVPSPVTENEANFFFAEVGGSPVIENEATYFCRGRGNPCDPERGDAV